MVMFSFIYLFDVIINSLRSLWKFCEWPFWIVLDFLLLCFGGVSRSFSMGALDSPKLDYSRQKKLNFNLFSHAHRVKRRLWMKTHQILSIFQSIHFYINQVSSYQNQTTFSKTITLKNTKLLLTFNNIACSSMFMSSLFRSFLHSLKILHDILKEFFLKEKAY
jgi:hypothetical protein